MQQGAEPISSSQKPQEKKILPPSDRWGKRLREGFFDLLEVSQWTRREVSVWPERLPPLHSTRGPSRCHPLDSGNHTLLRPTADVSARKRGRGFFSACLLGVWSLNLDLILALFSRQPCQPRNKKANSALEVKESWMTSFKSNICNNKQATVRLLKRGAKESKNVLKINQNSYSAWYS